MARILLTAIGLIWAASAAQGQTIHVLIVGDTNDPWIGKSVAVDLGNVAFAFSANVPGTQLHMEILRGEEVSAEQVTARIRGFRARASDAMVFFWSGHGGFDESGHFFKMPDGTRLYRATVVAEIKKRGAGLDAVLSDCCHTFVPLPLPLPACKAPWIRGRIAPLFESLFLKVRGLVDINGASEGEVGLGDPIAGGTFFGPLVDCLLQLSEKRMSWKDLVADVQPRVRQSFEDLREKAAKLRARDIQVEEIKPTTQTVKVWHLPGWPDRFGITVRNKRGSGVLVSNVEPRSPAAKAEVDAGDVILEVNGVKIASTQQMLAAVANSPQTIKFVLQCGKTGRIWNLEAKLRD